MEKTDKLVRHGSLFVVIAMFGNVFNLLFNVVMTRALGPYDYGIFATLLSLLAVIGVPSGVIQMTVARYIAQYSAHQLLDNMRYLLRAAVRATLIVGLFGGIILLSLQNLILSQLNIQLATPAPIAVLIILFAFGLVLPVLRGGLQGLQKFPMLGVNVISDGITRLVAGIVLVYFGFRVVGALGASLVAIAVGFVLSVIPLVNYLKKPEQIEQDNTPQKLYSYAIPVLFYFLGKELFARLDIFVISRYLTEMRGFYTAAALIGIAFWAIPAAIITVMFPKVAHTHAKNESPLHLIQKSLLFSGLLCIIGIAVCFIFPGLVIAILYGEKYPVETMTPLIKWFSIAVTPFALANVLLNYHLAKADHECIELLISGVIVHGVLLWLFHQTVYQVLTVIFISGILQIIANYWLLLFKENQLNKLNS
ncbi:MAG: oligosaccharide flippase family protein [bacterium]|nr:oligosaccharide flippase family protein [bacterium]